jgi:hypothetical protein
VLAVDSFYFKDIEDFRNRSASSRQSAQGCNLAIHFIVAIRPADLESNVSFFLMISREPNRCKTAGPELVHNLVSTI